MAPPSQKHRKIGFYLEGGGGGTKTWNFVIRPEELTRQEPSRLAIQQTLGGAWADSFDRGVSFITLAGHTGWRGGVGGDGAAQFEKLRATVFTDWHERRATAAARGQDPDDVKLFFADTLDKITALVAVKSFSLRRSKSSPLVMKYQIQLAVLDDAAKPDSINDAITGALFNPLRWLAAKLGLENLFDEVGGIISDIKQVYSDIVDIVTDVCAFVQSCVQLVLDVIDAGSGVIDELTAPILQTVQMVSEATRNGFAALARAQTAFSIKSVLMRAASAMNDIACTINHGFDTGRYFRSYDDLFGASSCSSTGGGRPWSTFAEQQKNPFNSMFPPVSSRMTVSTGGRDALDTLRRDPLTLTPAVATQALAALPAGVTVS